MSRINPYGIKPDNMRRHGDGEQTLNRGRVEAAGRNTEAPRRLRKADSTLREHLGSVYALRDSKKLILQFLAIKIFLLSWVPQPSPALIAIAMCICLSNAVKGHSPGDMRYAGFRKVLQSAAALMLGLRWIMGLIGGFENNAWWLIRWLPDFVRNLGNVDSVFRVLLVDPIALVLTIAWLCDTWIPVKVSASLVGENLWTNYRQLKPEEIPGNQPSAANWIVGIPFLLIMLPQTTADWIYALALGLLTSFIVAYVVVVEALDILCVKYQDARSRARHHSKFSDRRYIVLHAIAYGVPRLILLMFPLAALAIVFAGKDQWLSLAPLGILVVGSFVLYPWHVGLSWEAIKVFETYPGGLPAQPGVHDISEVMRNPTTRANLMKFAAYSWVPFTYGCVYHFLPSFPQFDEWGPRWPDLDIWNFLFALLVLCILPGQLVCGVLRACYGPILGRLTHNSKEGD